MLKNEGNVIPKLMTYRSGNTLLEYGLVGALVILVCIAGFLTAGNNLDWIFSALKNDMTAHRDVAAIANASTAAAAEPGSNPVVTESPLGKTVGSLTEQDLAKLGQDLGNKLQTTGANGTTQILSKQLEVLSQQLLEQGKISQAESDAIMRLANQGYHIAKIESMVEDAVRMADGDMNKLKQLNFNLDGQSYPISELVEQIGFKPRKPTDFTNSDILTDFQGEGSVEMEKFRQLYTEALSSGVMTDPAIRATIQSAATQIATVAESVEDNMWAAVNESEAYPIRSVEELNLKLAGSSTQMNSSKICKAGDFQDNGVVCSK